MALQSFPNGAGLLITPAPNAPAFIRSSNGTILFNAAGESAGAVGYLLLSSGPGTSKTISSAGGKVHFRTGTITFANAGTTVRVGVQDVTSGGVEDGTFDVSADLIGGGGGLATNTNYAVPMTSGSKTIAYGDLVAIVFEMTSRGGTDSVTIARSGTEAALPYGTQDSGSGPSKLSFLPAVTIEFDDGTLGWFTMDSWLWADVPQTAFGVNSTPDEHALIFRLPVPCEVVALAASLDGLASTDDFELILYSDPLGTPVAERTISADMDLAASGASADWYERPITPFTLAANTDYALGLRPTTTNTLSYWRLEFSTAALRATTLLGTNWSQGTRTNQTGAFTQTTTTLPLFGIRVSAFADDTGAGGGSTEHAYVFVG